MALFPFFRNIEGAEALVIGGGKHALEKVERLLPYGPRLHVIAEDICEKLTAYVVESEAFVVCDKESEPQSEQEPIKVALQNAVVGAEAFAVCDKESEPQSEQEPTKVASQNTMVGSEKNIQRITYSCRKFREEDLTETVDFVIVAGDDAEENHRIANLCRARRIPVNVVDDQEYCDFIFPSLIARGSLSVGICTNGASPSTGVLLKKKIEAQIPDNIEEILDFLQEKRSSIKEAIPDKKKRFAFYYKISEICMEEGRVLTEEEFTVLLSAEL